MYSRSRAASQESYESLAVSQLSYITDEEFIKAVEELKLDIKLITTENEILQKTINRLDPSLMQGVYQALEYIKRAMQSDSQENFSYGSFAKSSSKFGLSESLFSPSKMFSSPSKMFTSPSKMFTSPSKMFSSPSKMFTSASRYSNRAWVEPSGKLGVSVVTGSGPRINLNERLELATIAMKNLNTALNKTQVDAKKQQALLKAEFEEIEIQIDDIQKTREKFESDVIIDGLDSQTHRIPAEIWIRFISECTRLSDKQIGRFRLRTSTLNTQYRKLKDIVKSKAELHERLEPVDFDKMEIENEECLKLLESKTLQLDELKTMAGDAHLTLAIHKKFMLFLNNYLAKVRKIKTRRELQTEQIDQETKSIQVHVDNLKRQIDEIRDARMEYHVPKVVDYVNAKIEASEMKNAIKRLETKLQIKKTALATTNKQLKIIMSQKALFSTPSDIDSMP